MGLGVLAFGAPACRPPLCLERVPETDGPRTLGQALTAPFRCPAPPPAFTNPPPIERLGGDVARVGPELPPPPPPPPSVQAPRPNPMHARGGGAVVAPDPMLEPAHHVPSGRHIARVTERMR